MYGHATFTTRSCLFASAQARCLQQKLSVDTRLVQKSPSLRNTLLSNPALAQIYPPLTTPESFQGKDTILWLVR
jgi:hypothetical protein